MRVTIIGTGNLAWHMAVVLEEAGCTIDQIYGRSLDNAKIVAKQAYGANITNELDFRKSKAELFFLCVSDQAFPAILEVLELPKYAGLVHCSGTTDLLVLENFIEKYGDSSMEVGVFYPLMTLKKGKNQDFNEVPLCIESNSPAFETKLVSLAQKISKVVYEVNSKERLVLHLGAVLSNNFVNHLLALTQELLDEHDLEFDLLFPIIKKTFAQAVSGANLHELQTGPALRNDSKTMLKHEKLLAKSEKILAVYEALSNSIKK
jgi:predicted short-subunit dehydrogenase-like oxidoreductase (DUF2520 family)